MASELTSRDYDALRQCAIASGPWVPPNGMGRSAVRLCRRGLIMSVLSTYGYKITDAGLSVAGLSILDERK